MRPSQTCQRQGQLPTGQMQQGRSATASTISAANIRSILAAAIGEQIDSQGPLTQPTHRQSRPRWARRRAASPQPCLQASASALRDLHMGINASGRAPIDLGQITVAGGHAGQPVQ